MPRKIFVAGEILTAADVNTNLMDQAVMVFDDATDRATAIPTPVEGMVTYLKDDDEVTVFDGSVFAPIANAGIGPNVVTFRLGASFSTVSSSFSDTGLAVTITPTTNTSRILVMCFGIMSHSGATNVYGSAGRFARNGAGIGSTEAAMTVPSASDVQHVAAFFLDSPATTSPVEYTWQLGSNSATAFWGRSGANASVIGSRIIAMEVAA